jgi:hypothetical protein
MRRFVIESANVTNGVQGVIQMDRFGVMIVKDMLEAHMNGDFGELCEEDIPLNEEAIRTNSGMVMSIFPYNEEKIWIITYLGEGGYTTILLPEEY